MNATVRFSLRTRTRCRRSSPARRRESRLQAPGRWRRPSSGRGCVPPGTYLKGEEIRKHRSDLGAAFGDLDLEPSPALGCPPHDPLDSRRRRCIDARRSVVWTRYVGSSGEARARVFCQVRGNGSSGRISSSVSRSPGSASSATARSRHAASSRAGGAGVNQLRVLPRCRHTRRPCSRPGHSGAAATNSASRRIATMWPSRPVEPQIARREPMRRRASPI